MVVVVLLVVVVVVAVVVLAMVMPLPAVDIDPREPSNIFFADWAAIERAQEDEHIVCMNEAA